MLNEKSLLTGVARLHDSFCDACSIPLPSLSSEPNPDINITACEECGEAFFCGEECHNLAQDNYHPSLCGISFEQSVSAGEVVDSLYTLLLIRALALAETQAVHPLELKEVRYIWGDYHGLDLKEIWESGPDVFKRVPLTLPFSFESNILKPLHILEKMDVNIFEESYRYDTWVFNTLYAKFRGQCYKSILITTYRLNIYRDCISTARARWPARNWRGASPVVPRQPQLRSECCLGMAGQHAFLGTQGPSRVSGASSKQEAGFSKRRRGHEPLLRRSSPSEGKARMGCGRIGRNMRMPAMRLGGESVSTSLHSSCPSMSILNTLA